MARDYSKISPQFWTGRTGRALRGDVEAQIVALYLMTSPHSNMIGVFGLPILYVAHETGLSLEEASKGLARCIEGNFCTYDAAAEVVFVHGMARHQVGADLKSGDKRLIGVRKQYSQMAEGGIKSAFHNRYGHDYGLPGQSECSGNERPFEGPRKPGTGTGTGTGVALSPRGGHSFARWIESLAGGQAIPATHGVFDYTDRVGIPGDFLALAWSWFERTYGEGGPRAKKRYADWPAVFRNAVEGNWAKAWFCDGGAYKLTTVGIQLQRESAAAV